ncbi:hypothetical protein ACW9YQ_17740 (plasmid) [Paraburkholderia strydomiana]
MTSVATFGDATAAVAQQTTEVLPKMPQNCLDLRAVIAEQRLIGVAALSRSSPPKGASASSAQNYSDAQREKLSEFVKFLGSVDSQIKVLCARMSAFAPALELMSTSLANYGSAIKALAQDSFVTYRPEFDTLPKAIGAIPAGGAKTLLTSAQVSAITGLQALIYKAATESYRQAKLKEVLDKRNQVVLMNVVTELQKVTANYAYLIYLLGDQEKAAAENGQALETQVFLFEPIAVQEYAVRMSVQRDATQARMDALNGYGDVLRKVQPAFEKARESIDSVSAKDVAIEVKDFAQSAYSVQKKLRDAF